MSVTSGEPIARDDFDGIAMLGGRVLRALLSEQRLSLAIDGATLDNCITSGGCKNLEEVRAGSMKYLLGHGLGMLKNAPHPNASAVFMNWFFSKDGQEAFVKGIKATEPTGKDAHSVNPGVEPSEDSVKNGMVPEYSNLN